MVFGNLFGKKSTTSKRSKPKKDDPELQKAAALLFYKMVRSDGVADQMELIHLKEILRKEFKLEQEELDELARQATQTNVTSISVDALTAEIRKNCGNAQRIKMLEYLWILAFVDDRIDKKEADLVNQVAQQLYLSDAEMARAQENAESALGIGF